LFFQTGSHLEERVVLDLAEGSASFLDADFAFSAFSETYCLIPGPSGWCIHFTSFLRFFLILLVKFAR
jgi:hypothetical protein